MHLNPVNAALAVQLGLCLISTVAAEQQVFAPDENSLETPAQTTKERIAIIGAGAGGSSAAYYLQKYSNYSYAITVYDKNDYIGGRTTTVNVHDDARWPVELGASIFVKQNLNLVAAVQEFGLEIRTAELGRVRKMDNVTISDSIGIWNGKSFVYEAQSDSSWLNMGKLLWKYGMSPIKARSLAKKTVAKFLNYYSSVYFPFKDLTTATQDSGLTELTGETTLKYFTKYGISKLFTNHIVQAATRVNYAQNVHQLHALEATVCLAADEGLNVEGGNWKIFDNMLKASGADLQLSTAVSEIVAAGDEGKFLVLAGDSSEEFDQVIIASPYHQTGIKGLELPIKKVPYMTLHVTLVASTKRLSPAYFGLADGAFVPTMVLTTMPETGAAHSPPLFNSVSIVRYIPELNQYVYKIFSPSKMQPAFLQLLFEQGAEFPWVYEKVWNPYPRMDTIEEFQDWKVHEDGIWYLNGMEQFISTMETSSLAGANVAALIVGSANKTALSVP
ncbi:putative prenylcysteine lyase [Myxozyma melibiosi]|uniref:Prenylcysteine lyase n=1 Tax=Myxozyma melibiosi TaxID=54550 RepID=A0ABR1F6S3_9ASCO